MIHYYCVQYNGQTVMRNVRAFSEKDACDQVYMRDRLASASAYTGRARHNYTAVKQ